MTAAGARPPRLPSWADTVAAVEAQWGLLRAAVGQLDDDVFDQPTRLGTWRVAQLVAHLAGNARNVVLAAEGPRHPTPVTTAWKYFDDAPANAALIASLADESAAGLAPAALRALLDEAMADARAVLAETDGSEVVFVRGPIRFSDYLVSRCLEAVVHGLDLRAATGLPPEPDPAALRTVVRLLAGILVVRAPGRSVELRVPGPSGVAVQCVPGPRHTRGTPANVVETDPVTFVEVATGRQSWAGAVAAGRIVASGDRADLSRYLPLLS